jgi:hypothetical protein
MTLARLRLSRGAQPPPSAGPADMSRKMQASSVTLFEMLDKGRVGSPPFLFAFVHGLDRWLIFSWNFLAASMKYQDMSG